MAATPEPTYNKPDKPGIQMGFDNIVSIYYIVESDDDFEDAALALFSLIKSSQHQYPDWPRVVYLDVNGHKGEKGGFDGDLFELQQEFMIATMGPFLTGLDMPLVSVWNPEPQRNDLPDRLAVQ